MLERILVSVGQLFLDPDNYRFAETQGEKRHTDREIIQEEVQHEVMVRMRAYRLRELEKSIIRNGWIEADHVIVRELRVSRDNHDRRRYVVVEGNRRVASLKRLLERHSRGRLKLGSVLLNKLAALPVMKLVADSDNEMDDNIRVIMGVRHVAGHLDWPGGQAAKLIHDLRTDGKKFGEIGDMLAISSIDAGRRFRAYCAVQQARNLDGIGREIVLRKHYSLFESALGSPKLREWLGWVEDDYGARAMNVGALRRLVELTLGDEPLIRNPSDMSTLKKIFRTAALRDRFVNQDVDYETLAREAESLTAPIERIARMLERRLLDRESLSKRDRRALLTLRSAIEERL